MNKQHNILFSVIVFATLTRIAIPPLFGHLPNFSAIDALALFCGAYCEKRWLALVLAVISTWIGDVLIMHSLFYDGCVWQYSSYALIALLGSTSRSWMDSLQKTLLAVTPLALTSATLFFIITNFGVWFSGLLYPHNIDGLIACYIAAIPFFHHTVMSDLLFSFVFFGSWAFVQNNETFPIRRNI